MGISNSMRGSKRRETPGFNGQVARRKARPVKLVFGEESSTPCAVAPHAAAQPTLTNAPNYAVRSTDAR